MKHDIKQQENEYVCIKCEQTWLLTEGYPARGCTVRVKRKVEA